MNMHTTAQVKVSPDQRERIVEAIINNGNPEGADQLISISWGMEHLNHDQQDRLLIRAQELSIRWTIASLKSGRFLRTLPMRKYAEDHQQYLLHCLFTVVQFSNLDLCESCQVLIPTS